MSRGERLEAIVCRAEGPRRWTRRDLTAALVCTAALAVAPLAATAQTYEGDGRFAAWGATRYLAANALLPAAAAGITAAIRGDSAVLRRMITAASGGAVHWLGKELAAHPDLPPVLGRGVAAVGASAVRNGVSGRPAFHCARVPVAVLWIAVPPCDRPLLTLDLPTTAVAAGALLRGGRLDLSASARTGTVTIATRRLPPNVQGRTRAGIVLYPTHRCPPEVSCRDETDEEYRRRRDQVLTHEMVHVAQHDVSLLTAGQWLDRGIRRRFVPASWRALADRLELGSHLLVAAALREVPLVRDYLEAEALYLHHPELP